MSLQRLRGAITRFRKPRDPFSLENLRFLHEQLQKNQVVTDKNNELIIETLRQIAEVMIWGDQHNANFFDWFLENNILAFFLNILQQKAGQKVKIQLLQTLSILVTGIKSETSLYYLLSNNHINDLIIHKFDFSDEEVLAYYISFLKSLSLKLNDKTLQFFFNEMDNDFPLYTEAIKFFNHPEYMVRTAVRNLVLNVLKVENDALRRFILDKTAAPYFSNMVWFISDKCHTLDALITSTDKPLKFRELAEFVNELLDAFYYCNDIFHLSISSLNAVLSDRLLQDLLLPLFRGSLLPLVSSAQKKKRISVRLALFLLAQVFHIFSYRTLIDTLAAAVIHPNPTSYITQFFKPPTIKNGDNTAGGPDSTSPPVSPRTAAYLSYSSFLAPQITHTNTVGVPPMSERTMRRSFTVHSHSPDAMMKRGHHSRSNSNPEWKDPSNSSTNASISGVNGGSAASGDERKPKPKRSHPVGPFPGIPLHDSNNGDILDFTQARRQRRAQQTASVLAKSPDPPSSGTGEPLETVSNNTTTTGSVPDLGLKPPAPIMMTQSSPVSTTAARAKPGSGILRTALFDTEEAKREDESNNHSIQPDQSEKKSKYTNHTASVDNDDNDDDNTNEQEDTLAVNSLAQSSPGLRAPSPRDRRLRNRSSPAIIDLNKTRCRNKYRDALLLYLEDADDNTLLGCISMLYGLMRNPAVDRNILMTSGLFPFRFRKAKRLLDELIGGSGGSVPGFELPLAELKQFPPPPIPPLLTSIPEEASTGRQHPPLTQSQPQDDNKTTTTTTTTISSPDTEVHKTAAPSSAAVKPDQTALQNGTGRASEPDNDKKKIREVLREWGGDDLKQILDTEQASATDNNNTSINSTKNDNNNNDSSNSNNDNNNNDSSSTKEKERETELEREDQQQQRLPSNEDWTEKLLIALQHAGNMRLVTLQLCIMMLKELVYSQDMLPNLTFHHMQLLQEAYRIAAGQAYERLKQSTADVFLEKFETEYKKYKQLNYEDLIVNAASLMPLALCAKIPSLGLAHRLPTTEGEITQRAIQGFLAMRELKNTLQKRKDTWLPLRTKQDEIYNGLKVGDTIIIDRQRSMACTIAEQISSHYVGIYTSVVLILEARDHKFAVVRQCLPLDTLQIQQEPTETTVLHLVSNGRKHTILFQDQRYCLQLRTDLENASNALRDYKLHQIVALFNFEDDLPPQQQLQHAQSASGSTGSIPIPITEPRSPRERSSPSLSSTPTTLRASADLSSLSNNSIHPLQPPPPKTKMLSQLQLSQHQQHQQQQLQSTQQPQQPQQAQQQPQQTQQQPQPQFQPLPQVQQPVQPVPTPHTTPAQPQQHAPSSSLPNGAAAPTATPEAPQQNTSNSSTNKPPTSIPATSVDASTLVEIPDPGPSVSKSDSAHVSDVAVSESNRVSQQQQKHGKQRLSAAGADAPGVWNQVVTELDPDDHWATSEASESSPTSSLPSNNSDDENDNVFAGVPKATEASVGSYDPSPLETGDEDFNSHEMHEIAL
eukprot:TRINITY_DN606_c1_g1_i1.p1 TRINITY_DN606_c1_g1~~TRINITY_DN606_c1_g1_i1.p1  ORF type:complete len:1504 (+),score=363.67 TRINITY_DN606_c1_g1_i1:186-4697(+)